jgi:hypothetical protein
MQHGANPNNIASLECNCDKAEDLVESIESIFVHLALEPQDREQQDE